MKLTLGKKLFVYTSGTLSVLLLVTFLLLEKSQSRYWENYFKSQAVSFVRFATPELLKVFRGSFPQQEGFNEPLQEILERNSDLVSFSIYSPGGKLLFDSPTAPGFQGKIPSDLGMKYLPDRLKTQEINVKTWLLPAGGRILDLLSPAFGPTGEQILAFRYLVSYDSIDSRLQEVRLQFLKIAVVTFLSSLVLVAFVARRLTLPIKQLTDGVRAVGREELQTRIGIRSTDEIGALATAFNEMAENLAANRSELTEKNRALVEANSELHQMQEQLVRAERLATIGQLAAGVSHEIDNPVGIILGYAELLLEDFDKKDPRRDDVIAIIEECKRCKRITGGLLGLARSTSGSRDRIAATLLAQEVITSLHPQKLFKGIHLDLRLPGKEIEIRGDGDQIRQVLVNILLNAGQAMNGKGRITIDIHQEGQKGVFIITDTGPGIPPELRERIFEPFYSTKSRGEGTGLGLSVCQNLVEEHGGKISAEPAPGGGALFRIELPLAEGENSFDNNHLDSLG